MAPERDDRVYKQTHVLGAFIVPFLLVAFVLLYFFPGSTKDYFAWEIHPDITPLIMGAGYIAGAYFFARVYMEQRFHRIHVGFLPVTAFTIFMAIGSFAHLDRFLQDNVAFWIWMGLYVTTPILVPLAWWANRKTDPGTPEPGESRLPQSIRNLLLGAGAVQTLVALVLLLSPSTMIDVWPWMLDAADRADARRLVRPAGDHRDHDGPRRPAERDPDHAAEPGHRHRADPASPRRVTGGASTPTTRCRTCSCSASPGCWRGCWRSSCTCGGCRPGHRRRRPPPGPVVLRLNLSRG